MKTIILCTLFFGLNLYAADTSGNAATGSTGNTSNTNNNYTSVNNGGGCSQTTRSLSDLAVLSALFAALSIAGLKKRAQKHKARK